MKYLVLLLFCFPVIGGFAQAFQSGLEWDDFAYDTTEVIATLGSKNILPYQYSLKQFCPEIRNQGNSFSCVGWAVGYGAMSIHSAIEHNWTDQRKITEEAHSALFIYNQIKAEGSCKRGSKLSRAMEFVKNNGNCLANQFDQEIDNCGKQPSLSQKNEALKHAIPDYIRLFQKTDDAKQRIRKVKEMIASNTPVIIGLNTLKNFYQAKNATYWWPEQGNTTAMGGHALLVIGYDDECEAFQLMNSWGKNWGKDGFIWIKYKYFTRFCKYAYCFQKPLSNNLILAKPIPLKTEPMPSIASPSKITEKKAMIHLGAKLQLIGIEFDPNDQVQFKSLKLEQKQKILHVAKEWKSGDLFQLQLETEEHKTYLYIFSVDNSNTVQVHWPRKKGLNPLFEGKKESPLIPFKHTQLHLPTAETAFELEKTGNNHLVVLLSRRKIRDFKSMLKKWKRSTLPIDAFLNNYLRKRQIPKEDIFFDHQSSNISAKTSSKGYILPIIFQLECF